MSSNSNAKAEAEIRAVWKEMDDAFLDNDAKRLAKTILPEATNISAPNGPVYGRDAIEKMYANTFVRFPNTKYKFGYTDLKEIVIEGNMCSVVSEYNCTSDGKTTYGDMITTMKRMPDGKWYTLHNFSNWRNEERLNFDPTKN